MGNEEQQAQGGARFTPRAWEARRPPGNVEAAATLYYVDHEPLGGCPVADVYDAAAVPLIAAAPDQNEALRAAALFVAMHTGAGAREAFPPWALNANGEPDAEVIHARCLAALAKAEGRS